MPSAHRIDLQIARIELGASGEVAEAHGGNTVRHASRCCGNRSRKTVDPEGPPFRERGFDIQFQIPIFDGGEVRVRQATETYNQAFNRLTEKAVDVRSEARDAFRVYRSCYDIASHYQREVLPLREIISDEMQTAVFSSMQVDVFALIGRKTRQRIAALRAAIEAKRAISGLHNPN